MSVSERKSFGLALLIWFFLGGIGGHRIYVKEKISIILWYWLVCLITFGIIWLIDLFLLKGWIDKANRAHAVY
ncbi:NINE protein [Ectobacillus ponti]|uniref:TM2 domain-containing protein n=1 Tax=Ectobacillus ponti TaxID=2961894 RepID=A0AA42BPJ9_9BACI|nr:TM2 domain-containing protein [Ectobacillus ponti]MCP8968516.1 TM2 domain-containing protein [Ectobacillus ponti]